MEKTQETKTLMESVVIQLYNAEHFCESRCLTAQKLFLEGEKRRLRYLSTRYHDLIRFFETDFFDLFAEFLNCPHTPAILSEISNVGEFFKKTNRCVEDFHNKLHGYANDLMPCFSYRYAKILLCKIDEISNIIVEYNRIIGEGEKCNWDNYYIQRIMSKEQTYENIHDLYEEKENDHGYKN
jgi:hypothetical protein